MKFVKENFKLIILCIALVVIPVAMLFGLNARGQASVTKEYSLSELDDGVYGIYTVVSSSIPAQNYEMITLCVNGQVCTFKGNVNIRYCESGYKLILEDKRHANCDIMNVYVPYGTIEYSVGVRIGSRR